MDERDKAIKDILRPLKINWSDGGHMLRTIQAISYVYDQFQKREEGRQERFIAELIEDLEDYFPERCPRQYVNEDDEHLYKIREERKDNEKN